MEHNSFNIQSLHGMFYSTKHLPSSVISMQCDDVYPQSSVVCSAQSSVVCSILSARVAVYLIYGISVTTLLSVTRKYPWGWNFIEKEGKGKCLVKSSRILKKA